MRKATEVIFMRVTPEEKEKMKALAEAYDMTVTEMVKFWAFGQKSGPTPHMGRKTHLSGTQF